MKALLPNLSVACLVAFAGCRGEERPPPTGSGLASWSSYRGNAQNTGRLLAASTDVVVANPDGRTAWRHEASMGGSHPITGPDGTVYAASYDGTLFALDPATGTQKWAFATTGNAYYPAYGPSPTLAPDGTLYFGSLGGELYALDSATGEKKWQAPFSAGAYTSAALGENDILYLADFDGTFYAVDGSTGQRVWHVSIGASISAAPALSLDGTTVYFGADDGTFRALNTANGQVRWSQAFAGRIFDSAAVGSDGTVYFGSDQSAYQGPGLPNTYDGTVYALDGATGDVKWQFAAGFPVTQALAIAGDGTVYVPVDDGKFHALAGSTGAKKWELLTATNAVSTPAAVGPDGTVYFSSNGAVLAVDGSTGSRKWSWTFPDFGSTPGGNGGGNSAPTLGGDGKLYVWGVNTLFAVP
jgi:outer membrane protein assembly factor BamB